MPTISYSGKILSEKDEERELAELSEEEKEAILDDIYGRTIKAHPAAAADDTADNNDDSDITDELLDEYFDAIIALPEDEKENYMFACDYFPHLIRDESHPKRFLRADRYNPQLAAKRQVEYWNMRVKIFEGHAFDNITLNGAMKETIPLMVQIPNFFTQLPNDEFGRTVFALDKTNIRLKDYDDTILLRVLWFVVHEALRRRSTQDNGIVVLVIGQDSTWNLPSRYLIQQIVKSMSYCLPVRICCRHACVSSLFACVLPIGKYFASRDLRLRMQVHNSIKKPTMIKELETFGLHRENLPKSIGGNYNVKPTWLDECEQILREDQRKQRRHGSNKRQRRTSP